MVGSLDAKEERYVSVLRYLMGCPKGVCLKSLCSVFLSALIFAAFPTAAAEFFAVTPSGMPETLFPMSSSKTIGSLSGQCMNNRWNVIDSNATSVTCEAPLSAGQSMMGQLLLGNSYSTPPKRFFRFNVVEVEGVSRVQASGWMETQMAFGQVKRVDFDGPPFHNNVMGFMTAAGGKFPKGTTFPNHVFMGFQAESIADGNYRVLRVTEVTADSPAARSGMQVGDLVTRVAGKRFKDDNDYLDALEKAANHPSYEVQVDRRGASLKLAIDRQFRPAVDDVVVANEDVDKPGQVPIAGSVADELGKLLALKEKGVLSQDEFEVEKKKLLSRP